MKTNTLSFPLLIFLALSALAAPFSGRAEPLKLSTDLQHTLGKVQGKVNQGLRTEADFSGELKEIEDLIARHRAEKQPDVPTILMIKASIFGQIFKDRDQAMKILEQIKTEFPNTDQGKQAVILLASLQNPPGEAAGPKVGQMFPDFNEKDLAGQPLSVAAFKGKVVLVDFWATWCGPCVQELPNVISAYEKYHSLGFEIVGISLDQNKASLTAFIKSKKMTWPEFFDGKGWENKLAQKYEVHSIPASYLLDREGRIIARDLREDELAPAVANALTKH